MSDADYKLYPMTPKGASDPKGTVDVSPSPHSTNSDANSPPKVNGGSRSISINDIHENPKPCPQLRSSIFSLLAFSWLSPMLKLGASRPLTDEDIWDVYPTERVENIFDEFDGYWQHEVEEVEAGRKTKSCSLCRVFTKLFGFQFFIAFIAYGYVNADQLLGPYFLNKLITYAQEREFVDLDPMEGYKWVIALFVSAAGASILRNHSYHLTLRIFLRINVLLTHKVVRKAMSISPRFRNDGAINNLASSDTQKVVEFAQGIHNIWSAPIIIAVGVYMLYQQVGWPAIIGFVVMLAVFPFAGMLTAKQMKYQEIAAKRTDSRISIINDLLQGMRVVKMYAWEKPFIENIHQIRDEELRVLKMYVFLQSFVFGFMMLVPVFVSIVIFILYNVNDGDMDPATVFTTLALINVIRLPFTFLPMALAGLSQSLVAFSRIEEFLYLPDLKDQRQQLDHVGIFMENAQFTWEGDPDDKNWLENLEKKKKAAHAKTDEKLNKTDSTRMLNETTGTQMSSSTVDLKPDEPKQAASKPCLTRINLDIKAGELVIILGKVGSCKSSLLFGMLGEILQTEGTTKVSGSMAYVPQSAFIVNATARENILFGNKYNEARYRMVVEACALQSDFNLLPNGDLSEIGERGLTISGGQKQRINLARALYGHSSIIIMDDCLSAVDIHVGTHIFNHCINGEMKGRTRVLVTHSLQFVTQADKIIMMKDTPESKDTYTIGATGTYQELLETDEDFRTLVEIYNKGKENMTQDKSQATVATEKTDAGADKKEKEQSKNDGKLVLAEEREHGEVTWAVYLTYIKAGGSWLYYLALPFFFLATQTTQALADVWLAQWSNALASGDDGPYGINTPVDYLLVYGVLLLLSVFLSLGQTISISFFGIRAGRTLHRNLVTSIMGRSISWFDRTPNGRIINRFSKDFYLCDLILSMMMQYAIVTFLGVLGILAIIAYVLPIMLALFGLLAIFYYFITKYFRHTNREVQRLESVSKTPIYTHLGEILNGISTIRALKVQPLYITENYRRIKNNTRCLYYTQAVPIWLMIRLDFIGAVILLGSGLLAVASKDWGIGVTPGNFGLLISYALSIGGILNACSMLGSQVEAMMNSIERIKYFTDVRPEEWETWEAKNPQLSDSTKVGWPSKGTIVLDNLQMRYRADLDLVLRGLNLTIPAGKRVGIVGRTGSSKSSLLVALFRLVEPCGGRVLIDDVDTTQISLTDLRSKIAIIPQDATMFNGTLRYNLDPFDHYTDEEVWAALDYVQMHGIIERMPGQLKTLVSEAGSNLSTGQRQLLCLARALLRKPKIICLDEATANVDIHTDEILQNVIRAQFKDCTILTIAHRLNTILDYDLIVVMKNGQIAETGSPQELRENPNSLFSTMLLGKEDAH